MNLLKAVIIDDELLAIKSLTKIISKYAPTVSVIKSFDNVHEGLAYVNTHSLDVLFLDIDMPHLNGIEFVDQLKNKKVSLIYTTAHSDYAINAIKKGAHDYLLKPIDGDELIQSIQRLNRKTSTTVTFKCIDKIYTFKHDEIMYCKSDSNYTHLYLTSNEEILLSYTLKSVEEQLKELDFIRVHQSYLVNKEHIKDINRGSDYSLQLKNGVAIPVSVRKRKEIQTLLG